MWRIYCLYCMYCLYCIVRCSCVVLLRKCREMNVELFRTSHWIQMNVATAFACNTSSSTCVAHLCRSLRQKFANFFTFHHKKEYTYKKYFNSKQIMHIWVWLASKRVKFCNRTFGLCHEVDQSGAAPGGGRVLPYMGYMGMCRCKGYGFQAVYSRIGYINQSV